MKETAINKIGIDFDNTLVKTTFNSETGKYDMGTPIEAVCDAVNQQALDFHKQIVIWTARPKKEWPEVRKWLDEQGVVYHKIKKKVLTQFIVDDRAMRPEEFVIWNRQEHQLPEELPYDGRYDSDGRKI
jgi:hypothetical protein